MRTVYLVLHVFDIDGGMGDAKTNEEVVACFENKDDAYRFVEKYTNKFVYNELHDELWCGELYAEEIHLMDHKDSENTKWMWIKNRSFSPARLFPKDEALRILKARMRHKIDWSNGDIKSEDLINYFVNLTGISKELSTKLYEEELNSKKENRAK